jgi:hypothetical protein
VKNLLLSVSFVLSASSFFGFASAACTKEACVQALDLTKIGCEFIPLVVADPKTGEKSTVYVPRKTLEFQALAVKKAEQDAKDAGADQ